MKKIALSFLCLSMFVLGFSYAPSSSLSSFCSIQTAKVIADASELELCGIEALYVGKAHVGTPLQKEDFEVFPIYKEQKEGKVSHYKGEQLNSSDFLISPDTMTNLSQYVSVSYKEFTADVLITCVEKGTVVIKTKNLSAVVSVNAVLQDADNDLLNDGKDIVYTIQSREKTNPLSDVLLDQIERDKSSVQLKSYEIEIVKDVTGEQSQIVKKVNEPVYLTMNIPAEYIKKGRKYWMLHEQNGIVEKLEDLDDNLDTITIKTSSFSDFVLCGTAVEIPKGAEPNPKVDPPEEPDGGKPKERDPEDVLILEKEEYQKVCDEIIDSTQKESQDVLIEMDRKISKRIFKKYEAEKKMYVKIDEKSPLYINIYINNEKYYLWILIIVVALFAIKELIEDRKKRKNI